MTKQDIFSLINKYQKNAPRYTSYPTANHFSNRITGHDYKRVARAGNHSVEPKPLSLYIHIPFCRSLCYYCGCNKIVTQNESLVENYLGYLYREIAMHGELYDHNRQVTQLHIGGGTPTYLSVEALGQIIQTAKNVFNFSSSLEMSIEIDPRTINAKEAEGLASIGFNRYSLGIQDLDSQVQKAINRIQTFSQIKKITDAIRSEKENSLSFDLIYGLPFQTTETFAKTLDAVLTLMPDRVALYNYSNMPHKIPSHRVIPQNELPDADEKLRIFMMAKTSFEEAGYIHLGMDHFVRPTDTLAKAMREGSMQRNFQGYSTHSGADIIGMGVSAISFVNHCYVQNSDNLRAYRAFMDKGELAITKGILLNEDDQLRADVIQNIMCSGVVNWQQLNTIHDVNSKNYFARECLQLEPFIDDSLIESNSEGFRVTTLGRNFLRSIAMVFDNHAPLALSNPVDNDQKEQLNYSKMF